MALQSYLPKLIIERRSILACLSSLLCLLILGTMLRKGNVFEKKRHIIVQCISVFKKLPACRKLISKNRLVESEENKLKKLSQII